MRTCQLMYGIMMLISGFSIVQANETASIQWNEQAQMQTTNENESAGLGSAFPAWRMKQMTWPSASEIEAQRAVVDPNSAIQCMQWLSKFMKKEQLPGNFDKYLIAMKGWGLIRKQSEQKRLCDVFITRLKKGSVIIQIQESPGNVVIVVTDEQLLNTPEVEHINLIVKTAGLILNNNLKPNPDSDDFHIFKLQDNKNTIRVSWPIESVIERRGNRPFVNAKKAHEIGTYHVLAETDGRTVIFDIPKGTIGPAFPDPYMERF